MLFIFFTNGPEIFSLTLHFSLRRIVLHVTPGSLSLRIRHRRVLMVSIVIVLLMMPLIVLRMLTIIMVVVVEVMLVLVLHIGMHVGMHQHELLLVVHSTAQHSTAQAMSSPHHHTRQELNSVN